MIIGRTISVINRLLLLGLLAAGAVTAAEPVDEREFLREVMGQSREDVKSYLGAPDFVRVDNRHEYWIYRNRVRDMLSGKVFKVTQVLIVDGRVADSIHSQVEQRTD